MLNPRDFDKEESDIVDVLKDVRDAIDSLEKNLTKTLNNLSVTNKSSGEILGILFEKVRKITQGPQGNRGEIGPIGPSGKDGIGIQGIPGKDGHNGHDGIDGRSGNDGTNGTDATELSASDIIKLLESLKDEERLSADAIKDFVPTVIREAKKVLRGTKKGGSGGFSGETPSGAINDLNTTFTLTMEPPKGFILLFVNGQLQTPVTHYTLSGRTITMLWTLPTDNQIYAAIPT